MGRVESSEGHPLDVTSMRDGGHRAECGCGWWTDTTNLRDAERLAQHHATEARQNAALLTERFGDLRRLEAERGTANAR